MKKQLFFENTRLLSDAFGIIPLMYGSLGLEYRTGESLNADDIDILIPKAFLSDKWEEFRNVLEKNGYILIDEHEHTFDKDGVHYSYAQAEELEAVAGIPVTEIETIRTEEVSFGLLSLEQYLRVYSASVKDGYRVSVRNKKDSEKIEFIRELMKK